MARKHAPSEITLGSYKITEALSTDDDKDAKLRLDAARKELIREVRKKFP